MKRLKLRESVTIVTHVQTTAVECVFLHFGDCMLTTKDTQAISKMQQ